MNVLLVEANYKNKFPPLGLMKISQYHKGKKHRTDFVKGCHIIEDIKYDRIYITSLFTFEFKKTLETVLYYYERYPDAKIYFGGISATIISEKYLERLPEKVKLIKGQLTTSRMIDMDDDVNIDALIPDYDILDDIDYIYKESDSYFVHFSRGCVRNCAFCAVKILEPEFKSLRYLDSVINEVNTKYGIKKFLRVMDNNIMYLDDFNEIIDKIKIMGYSKDNKKILRENEIELAYNSLERRIIGSQNCTPAINRIKAILFKVKEKIEAGSYRKMIKHFDEFYNIIELVEKYNGDTLFYVNYKNVIINTVEKITGSSYIKLVVDMNQGIDARGIIEYPDRAKGLAEINLDPCRIAFDSLNEKDTYVKATLICHENGIERFSNYLLFNYTDTPEDLYERMRLNLELSKKYKFKTQFSFPMKYAPIFGTDRSYIGKHWSKLQLDGFYAMLNATKGVVINDESFFERAYGKNGKEFYTLLHLPYNYIKNRQVNDDNGLIGEWLEDFKNLNEIEVLELRKAYVNGWKTIDDKIQNMKRYYVKRER